MQVQIQKLSSDTSPVVGISICVVPKLTSYHEQVIFNNDEELIVPAKFYSGDVNLMRAEIHKLVDDIFDQIG